MDKWIEPAPVRQYALDWIGKLIARGDADDHQSVQRTEPFCAAGAAAAAQ